MRAAGGSIPPNCSSRRRISVSSIGHLRSRMVVEIHAKGCKTFGAQRADLVRRPAKMPTDFFRVLMLHVLKDQGQPLRFGQLRDFGKDALHLFAVDQVAEEISRWRWDFIAQGGSFDPPGLTTTPIKSQIYCRSGHKGSGTACRSESRRLTQSQKQLLEQILGDLRA